MDRNTEVELAEVYTGIVEAISAQFPGVHVEAERDRSEAVPAPAILVEMNEMQGAPDHDPGTGQLAVTASFSAQVILNMSRTAKMEVRTLAAALAAFARLNRWGRKIGPAEVLGAFPDDFDPELDRFEIWRVDWQQVIHLGKTVWTEGERPTTVMMGQVPMIGDPFESDYEQVVP